MSRQRPRRPIYFAFREYKAYANMPARFNVTTGRFGVVLMVSDKNGEGTATFRHTLLEIAGCKLAGPYADLVKYWRDMRYRPFVVDLREIDP